MLDETGQAGKISVSESDLEYAIVSVLRDRFPDPRLSEIEISEKEACSIASEISARLKRAS